MHSPWPDSGMRAQPMGLGDTGEAVAPPWGQAVVTVGPVGLAFSGSDHMQQASSEP